MGKFDYQMPTDLLRQLEALSNVEQIAPQVLDEGTKVLEKYVKQETAKHRETGDLDNSIRRSKAKKNKYGYYASVHPTGKNRYGVRNMEVLAHLEFGTSDRTPVPILTKAANDAQAEVEEVMQKAFEEAVKL